MTSASQLILTALPGLPLIQPGDDLANLFLSGLAQAEIQLEDGDLLAVAQKIVSKAEGRIVHLSDVEPSTEAVNLAHETHKDPRLVECILRESKRILRKRPGLLIVEHRLDFVCANAGIDASNVEATSSSERDVIVLLPEDPDATAQSLAKSLQEQTGTKVGILIIDSHGRAWREGAVGVVIGLAGIPGVVDLRGKPDLFGQPLQSTQVGIADEVAAAASIIMGQAAEGLPVVHVRGFPYPMREGSLREIMRPADKDLFRD